MRTSTAWAWWDEAKQEFGMVYPSELVVRICSPDGFKSQEEKGEGRVLPVTITERDTD